MNIEAMAQLAAGGIVVHDNERKRKAVIEDGKVTNLIICAEDFAIEGKTFADAGEAQIGWTYQNGEFTPPQEDSSGVSDE